MTFSHTVHAAIRSTLKTGGFSNIRSEIYSILHPTLSKSNKLLGFNMRLGNAEFRLNVIQTGQLRLLCMIAIKYI